MIDGDLSVPTKQRTCRGHMVRKCPDHAIQGLHKFQVFVRQSCSQNSFEQMPESATHEFLYSGNNPNDINNSELLDTFRQLYRHYERRVQAITPSSTDSTVLARLGDELNEYKRQLDEVIFQLNLHHSINS